MDIEKQVCSIEHAKRLKELGADQAAHFWWTEFTDPQTLWCINALEEQDLDQHDDVLYAAFTVAELGEMLPGHIDVGEKKEWYCLRCHKDSTLEHWFIFYLPIDPDSSGEIFTQGSSEADARAKMLIYLLEKKLINA